MSPRDQAALKASAASAIAAGEQARDDLLAQLSSLTDEQILSVEVSTWLALGATRTAQFYAHRTGQVPPDFRKLASDAAAFSPVTLTWRDRNAATIYRLARAWESLPALGQGLAAAALALTISAPVALAVVSVVPVIERWTAPPHDAGWSNCSRLTPDSDHCLYTVQRELSWANGALFTGISIDDLRAANPAFANYRSVPAGSRITILRHQPNQE
jgi:hypothetical protein